jgi:hypothetical protein
MAICTLAVMTATFIAYAKLANFDGDLKRQVRFIPVRLYIMAKFISVAVMDTYTALVMMVP